MPSIFENAPLIRCEWNAARLAGKIVEFRLRYAEPARDDAFLQATSHYEGGGKFCSNGKGDHQMQLVIEVPVGNPHRPSLQFLPVTQRQADRIELVGEATPETFQLFDDAPPRT